MSAIFKAELDDKRLEELFQSEEKCYEFLAELKWSDGYRCRKCGNTNYCPGKTPYSRRCTKCKTEESQLPEQFFIIANSLSARHFILLIMFARERKIYQLMNLHAVYHFAR